MAKKKSGNFSRNIKKYLWQPVLAVLRPVFCFFAVRTMKIRPRRVLFLTFQGSFCCNPKYIALELERRNIEGLEIIWAMLPGKMNEELPSSFKKVRMNSFAFIAAAATAGIWVENGLKLVLSPYVKKRPGQLYFQPLHGSLGIKKQGRRGADVIAAADAITDFCISNSTFETGVYRGSYWSTTEILEYGHPRNDLLCRSREDAAERAFYRKKVRDYFGLPEDVKLALYAPTFREDGDTSCFKLDCDKLREKLVERFGGEWRVIYRMHSRDIKLHNTGFRKKKSAKEAIDGGSYVDMQELMLACEVGITDYSSWIYDYILCGNYGFIYASDREKYDTEWGLYYPLESTPFPVAETNVQLWENIASFDEAEYQRDVEAFLRDKGCFDDGRASERTVDKIVQMIERNAK